MANRFGSTSDMVIRPVEEHGATLLLAIDERGLYLTSRTYVDRNVADPNRYTAARATVPARLAALALDAAALAAAHQHLVQRPGEGSVQKKVNPLKASKRSMKRG